MIRTVVTTLVRIVAIVLALAAFLGPPSVSAHPLVDRSLPAADALLAAPPQRVEIWFTERIDSGAGSPGIELISDSGERVATQAQVDANDPYHVFADVDSLDFGTWTVSWQMRSLDDGHTVTGSFAFRVGSASRAPGAATSAGEWPQAWNVATRWATFLGAALVAGAAGLLVLCSGTIRKEHPIAFPARARPIALFGAAVAAIATLAEPWLLTRFPPANSVAPSIDEALDIQPSAWWMRLTALTLAVVLTSLSLRWKRSATLPLVAGGAGLIGILGLSMTGHAAARSTWRALAIWVDAIHQWSIALWIGMLIVIVLSWREAGKESLDRFSSAALPLVTIGVVAGVVNSALILPELSAVWDSDYGRVILAKVAVLIVVLALAWKNRSTLMRAAGSAADFLHRMKVPIRAEMLLAVAIVLGGSVLSLLAPPAATSVTSGMSSLAITHYSSPAPRDERLLTTLHVTPAKPGINDVGVSLTDLDGNAIPNDAVQRVFLDFASLTHQTSQLDVEATPNADGIWRSSGMQLSIADWWEVTVHIRRAGIANDAISTFHIVLPDPNVTGFPAASDREGDPAAEAVFQQAMTSLDTLHRVRYSQQIATGSAGQVVLSLASANDGFDGSTPAQMISTEQTTAITIGSSRWLSQAGSGRWGETPSNPPIPPSEWSSDYRNATGFRMGGISEVNGEEAQIITFYTPQSNLAPAYYAWWVSTETGDLLKIAMVSRVHYMTQLFFDFDGEIVILPPVNDTGTPVATPGLDISNLGG